MFGRDVKGVNNPMYGKKRLDSSIRMRGENNIAKNLEVRNKLKTAKIGYIPKNANSPKSEETRRKISESHKGMKCTEKTKLKISLKNKGANNPKAKKVDMYDKQGYYIRSFDYIKEAEEFIGKGDIKHALKNFNFTAGGYRWKTNGFF
jgi:hypothetical protein